MAEPRRVGPEFYELKIEKIMQTEDVPLIEKDAPIEQVLDILTKKTHVWVTEGKGSKKKSIGYLDRGRGGILRY